MQRPIRSRRRGVFRVSTLFVSALVVVAALVALWGAADSTVLCAAAPLARVVGQKDFAEPAEPVESAEPVELDSNDEEKLPFAGAATASDAELDERIAAEIKKSSPKAVVETVEKLFERRMVADAQRVGERLLRSEKRFLAPENFRTGDSVAKSEELVVQIVLALQVERNRSDAESFERWETLLDKTLADYPDSWRVKLAVVRALGGLPNVGAVVDGRFERSAEWRPEGLVSASDRDRVRRLRILRDAAPLVERELAAKGPSYDAFGFFSTFADAFDRRQSWLSQTKTDLDVLPDYIPLDEENGRFRARRAPVDADGNPVFFLLPESFEAAANDGERARFLRERAFAAAPSVVQKCSLLFDRAERARQEYGVQTLRSFRYFENDGGSSAEDAADGVWSLHTLRDDETIAKLATGVKRFALPEDVDWLKIWNEILELCGPDGESNPNRYDRYRALECIAREYSDRRQFDKAADAWRAALETAKGLGPRQPIEAADALERIVGNWGRIEPQGSKVLGSDVVLSFAFRNATSVEFVARKVRVDKLLAETKDAWAKAARESANGSTRPERGDSLYATELWNALFNKIGRKDDKNAADVEQYLGDEAARWTVELDPAPGRFDRRIRTKAPLAEPGAYLIESTTKDGNKDAVLVWTTDAAIVQKQFGDKKLMYYFADSTTGAPLANADVEIFVAASKNERAGKKEKRFRDAKTFDATTDENGRVVFDLGEGFWRDKFAGGWNVSALATVNRNAKNAATFAYLGFDGIWPTSPSDYPFQQTRAYFVSDRPIYRPEQKAEFKFWVGDARYDAPEDRNERAGTNVFYRITDPMGKIVAEKEVALDEFGAFADSFELGADATLGVYSIALTEREDGGNWLGDGSFRLEEYRKPEFEVAVDAPREPVALGDKFKATVSAKYYFGAPVTNATVKYKVERTRHSADWYPVRPWDWFYGNGYWWFAYDCARYPGWARWGCPRPIPTWGPFYGGSVPELVLEGEAPLDDDGKLEIEIDSALAKTIYPNDDQQYSITAEVVDKSRRTIVGTGKVFAATAPFKTYCWVDRGFYEAGEKIGVSFQTRRLDGKPVVGNATIRLLRVEYEPTDPNADPNAALETAEVRPIETEVFAQTVKTDAEGAGTVEASAARPGQYRVSCVVETENGLREEGGQLFVVRGASDATESKAAAKEASGKNAFLFGDLELIPEKAEYKVGETVRLQIASERPDATVLLFVRSENGVALEEPRFVKLVDGSACVEFAVEPKDRPNFFVEAATVSNGNLYTEQKEIVVPPESRVLNVEATPASANVKPSEKTKVRLRLTDLDGEPVVGQIAATVYDKSLEQLAGGPNTEDIRAFFWKWRRYSNPNFNGNLRRLISNLSWPEYDERRMAPVGAFGDFVVALSANGATGASGGMGGMGGGMKRAEKSRMRAAPARDFAVNSLDGAIETEEVAFADAAALPMSAAAPAPNALAEAKAVAVGFDKAGGAVERAENGENGESGAEPNFVAATVRKNLADVAFWGADLRPDDDGVVEVEFDAPENLTTWKVAAWAVGPGLRVGAGTAEFLTRKDFIVRLQKPRFLTQKDEVVISANAHNYLSTDKTVRATLRFPTSADAGGKRADDETGAARLALVEKDGNDAVRTLVVPAGGEARIDWVVRAETAGTATFLVEAATDEESDAMQETAPVLPRGVLKQVAVSGSIPAPEKADVASSDRKVAEQQAADVASQTRAASFVLTVPEARRPETTKATVRFSPTLAGAIFDALPYTIEYPYGCTEQTLNRFLPLVLAQKALQESGVDLAALRDKRANLNAQELGDAATRAAQWRRGPDNNPVFDVDEARELAAAGVEKLTSMQNADGGWGWFSGVGERTDPQLTALILRGLWTARTCDVAVDESVLQRARARLQAFEREEALKVLRGKVWTDEQKAERGAWGRWKDGADDVDAFVYFALAETGSVAAPFDPAFVDAKAEKISDKPEEARSVMREYVWEAEPNLNLLPAAAFAIALDDELKTAKLAANRSKDDEKAAETSAERVAEILRRLSQYRKADDENQTVWLDLNGVSYWRYWSWSGSEFETQAFYLRLLNRVDRETLAELGIVDDAPRLVKYLLNNRKNATYWRSTRDTAACVEAFSEYLTKTNEFGTRETVDVYVDGELRKTVEYTPETIFDVDGTLELSADELSAGDHIVELRVKGDGALYYNAYVEYFTLEDPITKAGLEVKAERRYYKLVPKKDATALVEGGRGQVVSQRVERFDRVPLNDGDEVTSGDLVEVELLVESKNDYESLLLEDAKAAGFEPVDALSGYDGNGLGAYVEKRDDRVCFFVSRLPQGRSSTTYRLRAETPGRFSALPAKIWGMYAPELKGNSDEFKTTVIDRAD